MEFQINEIGLQKELKLFSSTISFTLFIHNSQQGSSSPHNRATQPISEHSLTFNIN
jgi:hypothetical protein